MLINSLQTKHERKSSVAKLERGALETFWMELLPRARGQMSFEPEHAGSCPHAKHATCWFKCRTFLTECWALVPRICMRRGFFFYFHLFLKLIYFVLPAFSLKCCWMFYSCCVCSAVFSSLHKPFYAFSKTQSDCEVVFVVLMCTVFKLRKGLKPGLVYLDMKPYYFESFQDSFDSAAAALCSAHHVPWGTKEKETSEGMQ